MVAGPVVQQPAKRVDYDNLVGHVVARDPLGPIGGGRIFQRRQQHGDGRRAQAFEYRVGWLCSSCKRGKHLGQFAASGGAQRRAEIR
jgi:hypothetical protein